MRSTFQILLKIVTWILVTAVFIFVLNHRFFLANSYLIETGGMEYYVIYGIQQFLNTNTLYHSPWDFPFGVIQYGPAHYYLHYAISKFYTISPFDLHTIYQINRYIPLVFSLTFCGVLIVFLKKINLSTFSKWTIALLSFILCYEHSFGRPDAGYSFFILIGSLCYTYSYHSQKYMYVALTWLFLSIALFFKQTAILIIPVLWILDLIFNFNPKRIIQNTALLIICIGGGFTLFYEPFIFENIIDGVKNGIDIGLLTSARYFREEGLFFIAIWVFTIFLIFKNGAKPAQYILFLLSFLFFGVAFFTMMKIGSDSNYFYEFEILSLLLLFWLSNDQVKVYSTLLIISLFVFRWGPIFQSQHDRAQWQNKESYDSQLALSKELKKEYPVKYYLILDNEFNYYQGFLFDKSLSPIKTVLYDNISLNQFDYKKLSQFYEETNHFVAIGMFDSSIKKYPVQIKNYKIIRKNPYLIVYYK